MIKMLNRPAGYVKYAAVVTLTLGLALSACAAPNQDTAQSAPEISATEAATPTATAAPAAEVTSEPASAPATETAAAPAPAPVVPPAPKIVIPALKTFTFPDGHISFEHPSNWAIKTKQGPYVDDTKKANSIEAHIYDETGNELAFVASGGYGGGAAGPVNRTVLDSQALPAFPDGGESSHFAFLVDTYPFEHPANYFMAVVGKQFVTEGEAASAGSVIRSGNGMSAAVVVFDTPAFKSEAAAKAWMGTKQYSQLKALLTSLRYA
ncbi:MAG TPA: hypothetical protein VF885_12900 [Arthrobacter sp.]